jgi:hypothetical protein
MQVLAIAVAAARALGPMGGTPARPIQGAEQRASRRLSALRVSGLRHRAVDAAVLDVVSRAPRPYVTARQVALELDDPAYSVMRVAFSLGRLARNGALEYVGQVANSGDGVTSNTAMYRPPGEGAS